MGRCFPSCRNQKHEAWQWLGPTIWKVDRQFVYLVSLPLLDLQLATDQVSPKFFTTSGPIIYRNILAQILGVSETREPSNFTPCRDRQKKEIHCKQQRQC